MLKVRSHYRIFAKFHEQKRSVVNCQWCSIKDSSHRSHFQTKQLSVDQCNELTWPTLDRCIICMGKCSDLKNPIHADSYWNDWKFAEQWNMCLHLACILHGEGNPIMHISFINKMFRINFFYVIYVPFIYCFTL